MFGVSELNVTLNSASVAEKLTAANSQGALGNSASIIYFRNDITSIGSYITENFSIETTDKEGYIKYVKN